MAAWWVLARAAGRGRRVALIGLAVLVALVSGVVLATGAGARRTSSALERFERTTRASDMEIEIRDPDLGAKVAGQLQATKGVSRIATYRSFPVDAGTPLDFTVIGAADEHWQRDVDAPVVLHGRLPSQRAPLEIAVNEIGWRMLHAHLGDAVVVHTFAPGDLEKAFAEEGHFPGFHGPDLKLRVVGVVRVGQDLEGSTIQSGPNGYASSAFDRTYGEQVDGFPPEIVVGLARGQAAVPALAQKVHELVGADQEVRTASRGELFADSARSANRVAASALLAFALVAGLVGSVVVGIATARQVAGRSDEQAALAAVGVTRWARAGAAAAPAVLAAAIGVATGVVAAIAASPFFPIRLARLAEPHRGADVDATVLGLGALGLVLFVAVVSLVAGRRAERRSSQAAARSASSAGAVAARAGLAPSIVVGLRFAFDPAGDRGRSRVGMSTVGIALGVIGVIGVGVVGRSLDAVAASPARWGWTWSATPDLAGDADKVLDGVSRDPDVTGVAAMVTVGTRIDGKEVQSLAITPRKGTVGLAIRSGRAPAGSNEVALGARTAKALHVGVGDTVKADRPGGAGTATLRVVGTAVFPTIDNPEPGNGALVVPAAIDEIRQGESSETLVLRYRRGSDGAAIEKRLTDAKLVDFSPYSRSRLPGRIRNLRSVSSVIAWLGAFLALLGAAAFVHAVLMSTRVRRRDQAILRAIGFRGREVRTAVRVEAVAFAVVAAVPGIILGLAGGRVVWRAIVRDWGVLDAPSTPGVMVGALFPVALLLGLLVAWVAGRRLTATRPSALLRAE